MNTSRSFFSSKVSMTFVFMREVLLEWDRVSFGVHKRRSLLIVRSITREAQINTSLINKI